MGVRLYQYAMDKANASLKRHLDQYHEGKMPAEPCKWMNEHGFGKSAGAEGNKGEGGGTVSAPTSGEDAPVPAITAVWPGIKTLGEARKSLEGLKARREAATKAMNETTDVVMKGFEKQNIDALDTLINKLDGMVKSESARVATEAAAKEDLADKGKKADLGGGSEYLADYRKANPSEFEGLGEEDMEDIVRLDKEACASRTMSIVKYPQSEGTGLADNAYNFVMRSGLERLRFAKAANKPLGNFGVGDKVTSTETEGSRGEVTDVKGGLVRVSWENGNATWENIRDIKKIDADDGRKEGIPSKANEAYENDYKAAEAIYEDCKNGVADVAFLFDQYREDMGKDPFERGTDGEYGSFADWLHEDRVMQVFGRDGKKDRESLIAMMKTYKEDNVAASVPYFTKEAKAYTDDELKREIADCKKAIENYDADGLTKAHGRMRQEAMMNCYESELHKREVIAKEEENAKDKGSAQWLMRKVRNRTERTKEDAPVDVTLERDSSDDELYTFSIKCKNFTDYLAQEHNFSRSPDLGDGYQVINMSETRNEIIEKVHDDGSKSTGHTLVLTLRKKKELTPAAKKAAEVADRAEQAQLKAEFREECKKAFGDEKDWNGKSKAEIYAKDASRIVKLSTGDYITMFQPKMETKFCFGYGLQAQTSPDEAEDLADNARNSPKYFKAHNLRSFNEDLNALMVEDAYVVQDEKIGAVGAAYATETRTGVNRDLWGEDGRKKPNVKKLSIADKKKLIDAVEKERDTFEKKLDAYLKKYGTSKLRVWTYWADR